MWNSAAATWVKTAAESVPSAPTERRDRFGIYNWGTRPSPTGSQSGDYLNWSASFVASRSARTIRIELGFDQCGDYGQDPTDYYHPEYLKLIAQSPQYHRLFSDSRFNTYLLTTYTLNGYNHVWDMGYSESAAELEKEQIRRLGGYLISAFPSKTFILMNWEEDHVTSSNYPGYIAYTQARADAVREVRGTGGKLYYGMECACMFGDCGILNFVAPKVNVDYLSYSSWQSTTMNPNGVQAGDNAAAIKERLMAHLQNLLNKANGVGTATPRPGFYQPRNIIVGEFGFPRVQWCPHALSPGQSCESYRVDPTQWLEGIVGAVETFGASYAIYWQILDNRDPGCDFMNGRSPYTSYAPDYGLLDFVNVGSLWLVWPTDIGRAWGALMK
ncbi:MAG TPA: hypothetical protein VJ302_34705 [Blastocatellia bacterium]|nr:hypothetical protein [Blastocatellia bacterium]